MLAWRAEVHHGGDGHLADGLADGGVPLLPLALVVRLVAGVEQQPPAEGAPAALAAECRNCACHRYEVRRPENSGHTSARNTAAVNSAQPLPWDVAGGNMFS